MNNFRLIALLFTLVINLLLAILVYRNNSKSATSKIFGALALITSAWLIDVYLSDNIRYSSNALLWVRLSIFLAAPQIALFFLLSHTIPSEKILLKRKKLLWLAGLTLLIMVSAITPVVFKKVNVTNSSIQAVPGPGIAIFSLFAITVSSSAVYILIKRISKSTGYLKEQYLYVFGGILTMLGLLTLTVLIPVAVFHNSDFVPLVPLYTITFLGATTYAIIKNHLFNIRVVVAKSVTYVLLLGAIAGFYTGASFFLSNIFFHHSSTTFVENLPNIVVSLVLVFSFQPLRRIFERITDGIFYKEKYDPQILLNDISRVLASEINLKKLISKVTKIVSQQMKVSNSDIIVLQDNKIFFGGERIHSAGPMTEEEVKQLGKSIIITDDLDPGTFKKLLEHYLIRASVPLKTRDEYIGYLLIGEKLNGDFFSDQDRRVLRILADELAVAISNARAYEEIQQFNLTLQDRIAVATRQLRTTNEKLKALDETKDEFISMASHQLRTPLTSVKGYVSMVLDGDVGKVSDDQRKMLDQAYSSAQRMVYLIADLLNISRLKTGKFVIERVNSNLADAVEGEVDQLKETAANKNLELTFEKPKNFPMLSFDETKTRQVIMNYMDNAIYYTPSGGHIKVALEDKPDSIDFTVSDDGIGVPKAEAHKLFSKFYRAGNAQKARPDGTGLGLFMAKKVIAAQGGAIIFHSDEGKGSTFGFTFPKDKTFQPSSINAPKEPATAAKPV